MILIFGGGEIATKGIQPLVGGKIIDQKVCDITYISEVKAKMTEYKPGIVINCAGVSHMASIRDSRPDDWLEEMEVNLLGSYNIAKAAVDEGIRTLIFIASVAGLYGKPEHSGYSASKAGVISLVESLGMEGHDAYAISPGRVDTKMREQDYPREDKRTRLKPSQIGNVVKEILDGDYEPGDNIIIRKIGFLTYRRTDKGEPWRSYLKVGQPKTI